MMRTVVAILMDVHGIQKRVRVDQHVRRWGRDHAKIRRMDVSGLELPISVGRGRWVWRVLTMPQLVAQHTRLLPLVMLALVARGTLMTIYATLHVTSRQHRVVVEGCDHVEEHSDASGPMENVRGE